MGDTLKDRAIDYEYSYTEKNCSFYHAHLSISDLDTDTSQPFVYKHCVVGLVWEIYNKAYLLEISLSTKADQECSEVEVLAIAYCKLWKDFINYVNGEFAIFIYDRDTNTHYLFRDRWGTNLVYYRLYQWHLFFASEIKALVVNAPSLNKEAFCEYMVFQFPISPHTIVQNISSLRPGTYLEYTSGEITISEFEPYAPQCNSQSIVDTVLESITRRVPHHQDKVFVSLSGWPDSNLILYGLTQSFAWEIIAYSLVTENNKEEIEYASRNAKTLGVKHLCIDMDMYDNTWKLWDNIRVHEALVNLPDIHRVVKENYPEYKDVKVAFAWDGKEELLLTNAHYPYEDIIGRYKYFHEKWHIQEYHIDHKFLNWELFDFNLQMYDKVSLRNGVEVRLPYTDYELLRYVDYNSYRYEAEKFLKTKGIYIVPWEYGYGLWLKFKYFYDRDLLERKDILLQELTIFSQKLQWYL